MKRNFLSNTIRHTLLLIWLSCLPFCKAIIGNPSERSDSLLSLFLSAKSDSAKFYAADELVWEYMYVNPDTARIIAASYLEKLAGSSYPIGEALLVRNMGVSFVLVGNHKKARENYLKSLLICQKSGDKEGIASSFNGLGIIASREGNYPSAINYYYNALRIYEALKDKSGMANAYNNIGLIYERKNDFDKARNHYLKCLQIKEELNIKEGIARSLINIGNTYFYQMKHPEALDYFNRSLVMERELNDLMGIAAILNNTGVIYERENKLDSAIQLYAQSLEIREQISDKQGASQALQNLANTYFTKKEIEKSQHFIVRSLKLAEELGALERLNEAHELLSKIYKIQGNIPKAFEHFQLHINFRDSIYNKDNTEKIVQADLQYKFEKEQEKTRISQEKKDLAKNEYIKRQKLIRNSLSIGFALILLLAFMIFRNLQNKKRANKIITDKNKIVEEKNKEILDSIKYARHIQNALIPSKKSIQALFPDHFIIYRPKDIVSGDFYWMQKLEDRTLFAVVDCTGHGVPGAFISIVGHNSLNRAVNEFKLSKTGLILDQLNVLVNQSLRQKREESSIRDGMDLALCGLRENEGRLELEYSGSNNSLYVLRKKHLQGVVNAKEMKDEAGDFILYEIKADRQAIGNFEDETPISSFTTHTIPLINGDRIYIFTDGITDQFGGPNGKKFKTKSFKELLLEVQKHDMLHQKELILNKFNEWCGEHEQVDDICIWGIKI